ncbi:hypothetical protein ACI2LF_38070 [Kribbella sp. NPDC020789]
MEWWWHRQLADEGIEAVIRNQAQIVSRVQLLAAGWSSDRIRQQTRNRRWQTVHPGVYSTHTGPLGYDERLVAALLYAGRESAWSHHTAAEQLGLLKPDPTLPVHVVVPHHCQVRQRPGLVIHRDVHWADRLARTTPPRRTPAEAVLDIVGISNTLGQAAAVISEACQSGRVHPAAIAAALHTRGRLRHGRSLRPILADVAAGAHSLLELRYLQDVERRHGLPTGIRQRAVDREFTDVHYDGFTLNVELDGRLHVVPDQRWRDLDRDNRAVLRSETTLRYGWFDITGRPCAAAVQVVAVLRRTYPDLSARACSPTCPVR